MKYSQSFALLSLSTVMTLTAAVASQAQTQDVSPLLAEGRLPKALISRQTDAASIVMPTLIAQTGGNVALPTKPAATPLPPAAQPVPQPTPAVSPTPKPVATPTPATQPVPGTTPTKADALTRKVPVPEYLNPSPNPLLLPTQPAEVQLKGAERVTLEQAIELAERNNRTIEQAKLQVERSQAGLREAQASRRPTIALQGDFSRSKSADAELSVRQQRKNLDRDLNSDDQFRRFQAQQNAANNQAALRDADDPRTRLTTSLNFNYGLFGSGRGTAQVKAAERQLRLSELQLDQAAAQTRFDVADTYYQLQDAEEQIKINQAAIASSESNLRDTQAQFDAGLGTKFDVLRVQVQLANNQQQLTSAIANREIQRRRLAQRLSLPESLIVVPAEDKPQEAGKWPLSLEQTVVLAYKNRSELEQQLVQREISDARRKVALAALGPSVSVVAQLNFLEALEDSVGIGSGYSFGLQASWSLFDGGVAKAQADQQTKDKQIAESRFAEQRNTVRFEVEQAYATMLANKESIATTAAAITQAEEAERLAKLRFDAGVGTQTERIDAQSDLTRARGNNVSAIIGYNRALAQLRRAVSNLPADLSQIGRVAAK
jgi:outer membrane protein TolC